METGKTWIGEGNFLLIAVVRGIILVARTAPSPVIGHENTEYFRMKAVQNQHVVLIKTTGTQRVQRKEKKREL